MRRQLYIFRVHQIYPAGIARKVCTQRAIFSLETQDGESCWSRRRAGARMKLLTRVRSAFSQPIWGIIVAWVYRVARGKSHGNLSPGTKNWQAVIDELLLARSRDGWKHDRRTSPATRGRGRGGGRSSSFFNLILVYLAGIEREDEQVWVKARITLGLEAFDADADVSLALLTNTPGVYPKNFVLQASITTCSPAAVLPLRSGEPFVKDEWRATLIAILRWPIMPALNCFSSDGRQHAVRTTRCV